ncbi:hypothetical protein [Streptomyces sp. NPDC018031]|uniref:hypothetical protein n=1 Tax=Streptomyces sp. NPDC018031 TaxID=3365033 RepID=UPI0037A5E355
MSGPGPVHGQARGAGRVFQATGDQHIQEHHHHYPPGAGTLLTQVEVPARAAPQGLAPDSVRVPLVGRPPGALRDRQDLMRHLRDRLSGPGGVQVIHGMGGLGCRWPGAR